MDHAHGARRTSEDRLRAIEDRLEIYNLIASHPPTADTGAGGHARTMYAEDAIVDLGGPKTATGSDAIAVNQGHGLRRAITARLVA